MRSKSVRILNFFCGALAAAILLATACDHIDNDVLTPSHSSAELRALAVALIDASVTPNDNDRARTISRLKALSADQSLEVLHFSREHALRASPLASRDQARALTLMDELARYGQEEVGAQFGKGASLFKVSPEELDKIGASLLERPLVGDIVRDLDAVLHMGQEDRVDGLVVTCGGDCDYDTRWPKHLPWVPTSQPAYSATNCDRVKNDQCESPCDFRLHMSPRPYRSVDGLSAAAQIAVRNGVEGSQGVAFDRAILGYWRTVFSGSIPATWYLRAYVVFRTT